MIRQIRVSKLQEYDFEIIHRKGLDHVVPDALSRALPDCTEELAAEAITLELPSERCSEILELESEAEIEPEIAIADRIAQPTEATQFLSLDNQVGQIMSVDYRTIAATADDEYAQERDRIVLAGQTDRHRIADGLIFIKNRTGVERVVVPHNWREKIIAGYHAGDLACHHGYFKTYRRVYQFFTWPGMHREVNEYVKKCEICRATKPTNRIEKTPIYAVATHTAPFMTFSIDFVGPFPLTAARHQWLIVAINYFLYCIVFI